MPLSTEQRLRKHLAEAERHIAECEAQISRQRQVVDQSGEDAAALLAVLEDTRRIFEQHRELLRNWLEERAK